MVTDLPDPDPEAVGALIDRMVLKPELLEIVNRPEFLLPHIRERLRKWDGKPIRSLPEWSTLILLAGRIHHRGGDRKRAGEYYSDARDSLKVAGMLQKRISMLIERYRFVLDYEIFKSNGSPEPPTGLVTEELAAESYAYPPDGDYRPDAGPSHLEKHLRDKLAGRQNHDPRNPSWALILNNLALIVCDRGSPGQAASLLREALEMETAALPAHHPKIPHRMNNLTGVLLILGEYAEAAELNWEAWQRKCRDGHDITSVRILYIRALLETVLGKSPGETLGRLKYLLAADDLAYHGDVTLHWSFHLRLDLLRDRLNPASYALFKTLLNVTNFQAPFVLLDCFEEWKQAAPVRV